MRTTENPAPSVVRIVNSSKEMAWFRAFRGDFGYSHYGENRTSVTADIPFAAIIYTCILISLAAIIAAAGIRGREKWYTLARITYSLAVGSIILVSIFGYCWQTGEVRLHSPYIYRSKGHIEGRLGVRVGLKTVNLTLTGTFHADSNTMKYNEELVLENVLRSPDQLWSALDRGLPQPLLSIIEHFDKDSGGLRFGRSSWMAGYFSNILLWTAFAFWVTGNILILSVIWYGAACFTLTGVSMILAAVVYDVLCPQHDVRMPCSDGSLKLKYGWCFWSTLVFGILTTVIGLILFTLDKKVPKKLAEFFLLDNVLDEDEYRQINPTSKLQINPTSKLQINPTSMLQSIHTPDLSTRSITERHKVHTTPANWYMNYGFEGQRSRSNPVFTENILDSSLTATNDSIDSPRMRAFSNISEEDHTTIHSDATCSFTETTSVEKDHDATFDRLSEIYVDVEPSKHLNVPSTKQGRLEHELTTVTVISDTS